MQMTSLLNKNILLCVTGGIAAYKAAELCRLLIKQGARVRVVMSAAACEFIQPLTFQALTGEHVASELFDADAQNAMDHIDLARWADAVLVAPATADTLAKLANGYADNLLLTMALATEAPIMVAPAMNQQMYQNSQTQSNIRRLKQNKVLIWGPDEGDQACGEVGPGRMLEPLHLCELCEQYFAPGVLDGVSLLMTAGPTREAIDPVRYISNRSSGKMGYALAEAARDAGATVTLVSGPVCLESPQGVRVLKCQSAQQMLELVEQQMSGKDIFIATAAVADYRVADISSQKIKKSQHDMMLSLTRNPDVLAIVANSGNPPFCVGFAAETEDLERYALDKLHRKKLDMIAANRVDGSESGFEVDDNELMVYWKEGSRRLPRQSKNELAHQLIAIIADRFKNR